MHRPWMADGGVMLAGLGLIAFTGGPINDDRSPAAPGHRWHHDDPEALIAAPFFALVLVLVGLWGLFRWGLGDEAASWLVGALITGFLYYELLHHRLHHGRLPV